MNITDLPKYLQDLIHQRQREQGNSGTFDGHIGTFKEDDNFNWYDTPEHDSLWWAILQEDSIKELDYYRKLKS